MSVDSEQRVTPHRTRLVTACFLAITSGLVAMLSLEAMLVPLQNDFVFSVDDINVLMLAVSAGSLLILFPAGSLVDRLGSNRILIAGAATSVLGALIVAGAQGLPWLIGGRIIGGIGATAMAVSSLAILNTTFTDDRQRAYVFGLFAAVIGVTATVSPVIGGFIAQQFTWRLVPALWIVVALAAVALMRGVWTDEPHTDTARELLTPIAAGVSLSAACIAALIAKQGVFYSGVALAISASFFIVLLVRWRQLRHIGLKPGLDVSIFKAPGAKMLMGAMLSVGVVNLFFYGNLFMQYRLGLNAAQTAQLLVIPQVAGVLGGLLGGWISARIGSTRTTAWALALGCLAALSFLAETEKSGVWLFITLLTVFALPGGCLTGTLTKSFLDCADPDSSGAASSWRQAGWSLGTTLGGVASGAIIFTYFSRIWQSSLRAAGVDAQSAEWAAEAVRGGLPLTEIASDPDIKAVQGAEAITKFVGLGAAQINTLRLIALLAALAYAAALLFVLGAMWRKRVADTRRRSA